MPSDPTILAFDTSAAHCAAALLSGGRILGSCAETMTRGQAERLMPLLAELLVGYGIDWNDLDALGVGIGPGNFTGIRISVAAARGLAFGLAIPAYGVDGFAARRHALSTQGPVAVAAPRDQVYLSRPDTAPVLTSRADAEAENGPLPADPEPDALARAIAEIAAARWPSETVAPAPLYLRAADAAPASDPPPVLLD